MWYNKRAKTHTYDFFICIVVIFDESIWSFLSMSGGFIRLAEFAIGLGFQMVGVAAAERAKTFSFFESWLDDGRNAGMDYLVRHRVARGNPECLLKDVRSIIMFGVSFERVLTSTPHGIANVKGIACYARGVDYHIWIKERLKSVVELHKKLYPNANCRSVVDTAPLLERQYAVDAGLGQIGKNTMLITPQFGSNVFLAALLSTEPLHPAEPIFEPQIKSTHNTYKLDSCQNIDGKNSFCTNANNKDDVRQVGGVINSADGLSLVCGDCRRCIDACPSGGLVEPFVLDARFCLSYWTIEYCGELPEAVRTKLGGRFFGCDICSSVCPYNSTIPLPTPQVDPNTLDIESLKILAKGTPLERLVSRYNR
jgi:epoxyqueuosine reductase